MLIVWYCFWRLLWIACSNIKAQEAEHIYAMILSDEVSDDYGLNDRKESEENYVEPKEGDSKCAEDAVR
jgi:hypothetical protein